MSRAWVMPARAFSVLVSMVMLMFTLGIAVPASAVSPASSSNNGSSAAAHEKNAERKSDSSSTTRTAATGGDATDSGKGSTESTEGHRGGKKATPSTASRHQTSTKNGKYDEPQPASTADDNDAGANAGTCHDATAEPGGPYCSTRDGTRSGNGQGGKAVGKPCAGCVGKADNKNPPGQLPGPQDHNNGYECDDNNGVGHGKAKSKDGATSAGNPAHTGCVTPPTTSDDCVPKPGEDENCDETDDECVPKPGQDADCSTDEDEECIPSAANNFCEEDTLECPEGQTGTPPDCGEVKGTEDFASPPGANRPPTIKGVEAFAQPPAAVPQAGVLPSTGAAQMSGALTTLGFALLLAGGALIGLRRESLARVRR